MINWVIRKNHKSICCDESWIKLNHTFSDTYPSLVITSGSQNSYYHSYMFKSNSLLCHFLQKSSNSFYGRSEYYKPMLQNRASCRDHIFLVVCKWKKVSPACKGNFCIPIENVFKILLPQMWEGCHLLISNTVTLGQRKVVESVTWWWDKVRIGASRNLSHWARMEHKWKTIDLELDLIQYIHNTEQILAGYGWQTDSILSYCI